MPLSQDMPMGRIFDPQGRDQAWGRRWQNIKWHRDDNLSIEDKMELVIVDVTEPKPETDQKKIWTDREPEHYQLEKVLSWN